MAQNSAGAAFSILPFSGNAIWLQGNGMLTPVPGTPGCSGTLLSTCIARPGSPSMPSSAWRRGWQTPWTKIALHGLIHSRKPLSPAQVLAGVPFDDIQGSVALVCKRLEALQRRPSVWEGYSFELRPFDEGQSVRRKRLSLIGHAALTPAPAACIPWYCGRAIAASIPEPLLRQWAPGRGGNGGTDTAACCALPDASFMPSSCITRLT